MQEGKIYLASMLQSDGQTKIRPVLALKKMPNNDVLFCGISTQLRHKIEDFDEIITPNNINKLRATSLIRLSFLITLSENQIVGLMGEISSELHQTLIERLSTYLINK